MMATLDKTINTLRQATQGPAYATQTMPPTLHSVTVRVTFADHRWRDWTGDVAFEVSDGHVRVYDYGTRKPHPNLSTLVFSAAPGQWTRAHLLADTAAAAKSTPGPRQVDREHAGEVVEGAYDHDKYSEHPVERARRIAAMHPDDLAVDMRMAPAGGWAVIVGELVRFICESNGSDVEKLKEDRAAVETRRKQAAVARAADINLENPDGAERRELAVGALVGEPLPHQVPQGGDWIEWGGDYGRNPVPRERVEIRKVTGATMSGWSGIFDWHADRGNRIVAYRVL